MRLAIILLTSEPLTSTPSNKKTTLAHTFLDDPALVSKVWAMFRKPLALNVPERGVVKYPRDKGRPKIFLVVGIR